MLRQQITDDIKTAMKAHDSVRLGVLRYIFSEIKNREIDAKHELADDEVIELLRREVKRRQEAIDQFKQGQRVDLADKEDQELTVITAFLPQLMSREELETVVERVIAPMTNRDFGQVMRSVMQEVKGKADGKLVSEVVKSKL